MRHIIIIIISLLIVFPVIEILAQDGMIRAKGKIVDPDGSPLQHVTMVAKSNNIYFSTNKQGEFDFTLSRKDTVQISYMGYQTEYLYVDSTNINLLIWLKREDYDIQEVVVNTGYQRLKANEVNGAISFIDNETLSKQVGPNILERLEGVTNGVAFQKGRANTNPQNRTGITVRGYSTINGPLDPLIVIARKFVRLVDYLLRNHQLYTPPRSVREK